MGIKFSTIQGAFKRAVGRISKSFDKTGATSAASIACIVSMSCIAPAKAQEYNRVPASDNAQYSQCIRYVNSNYEGGSLMSPYKGQTKAAAWCTCAWNETPDDFRGNLGSFAETPRGRSIMKICDTYADWGI
jgi:hypothetical protein